MEINDFIIEIPQFFSPEKCKDFIDIFEKFKDTGFTYTRLVQGHPPHKLSDTSLGSSELIPLKELLIDDINFFNIFLKQFWDVGYKNYIEKFSILSEHDPHSARIVKIQRTDIGEGYHNWHCEDLSRQRRNRVLTFILYLNTVEEGGETEFLYYPKRIKAETGKFIMWPAGFTHTHRGNPPITNSKYIITGWVEV